MTAWLHVFVLLVLACVTGATAGTCWHRSRTGTLKLHEQQASRAGCWFVLAVALAVVVGVFAGTVLVALARLL